MIRAFFLVVLFAAAMSLPEIANAQNMPPSQQFGIGLFVQSGTPTGGMTFAYAINKNLHIGAALALESSSGGFSQTVFGFGPNVAYFFDGVVSPYVNGGFSIISLSEGTSTTFFSLLIGAGLAYYWGGHFGTSVGFQFIDLGLSPSPTTTSIGFSETHITCEWFMGR